MQFGSTFNKEELDLLPILYLIHTRLKVGRKLQDGRAELLQTTLFDFLKSTLANNHPRLKILAAIEQDLRVPDGLANAAGLVEVEWDGETVQVFAVDLRDRGELIKAMSATGGAK